MPAAHKGTLTGNPAPASWQAGHSYTAGALVQPTIPTGQYFQCQENGISAGSEPLWKTPSALPVPGTTYVDNTTKWFCMGSFVAQNDSSGAPTLVVDIPLDSDAPISAVIGRALKNLSNNICGLVSRLNIWTVTQIFAPSSGDNDAIEAVGSGTGSGVNAVGGGTAGGAGLRGTGGGAGGNGVVGTGGSGSGNGGLFQGTGANSGVDGTGGPTNGSGGHFKGGGAGTGVVAVGGDSAGGGIGVIGTGGTGSAQGGSFTGTGASPGVTGTGGPTDGPGGSFAGTGNGDGVDATAGGSGIGVLGAATSGAGVEGTATTGNGVNGVATGTGSGVQGKNNTGTGPGAIFEGNTTRGPIHMTPTAAVPTAGSAVRGDMCLTTEPHFYVCLTNGAWTMVV